MLVAQFPAPLGGSVPASTSNLSPSGGGPRVLTLAGGGPCVLVAQFPAPLGGSVPASTSNLSPSGD